MRASPVGRLLAALALGLGVTAALVGCQTWIPATGQTLPSPRYLEHPPQYIPSSPPIPLSREMASQEAKPTAVRAASGSAQAKLTVANVRGETALLFTVDPEGKLTFVERLSEGSATDLTTSRGTRWAAVFCGQTPGSLSFRVTSDEAIWLLRPDRKESRLGAPAP